MHSLNLVFDRSLGILETASLASSNDRVNRSIHAKILALIQPPTFYDKIVRYTKELSYLEEPRKC